MPIITIQVFKRNLVFLVLLFICNGIVYKQIYNDNIPFIKKWVIEISCKATRER